MYQTLSSSRYPFGPYNDGIYTYTGFGFDHDVIDRHPLSDVLRNAIRDLGERPQGQKVHQFGGYRAYDGSEIQFRIDIMWQLDHSPQTRGQCAATLYQTVAFLQTKRQLGRRCCEMIIWRNLDAQINIDVYEEEPVAAEGLEAEVDYELESFYYPHRILDPRKVAEVLKQARIQALMEEKSHGGAALPLRYTMNVKYRGIQLTFNGGEEPLEDELTYTDVVKVIEGVERFYMTGIGSREWGSLNVWVYEGEYSYDSLILNFEDSEISDIRPRTATGPQEIGRRRS